MVSQTSHQPALVWFRDDLRQKFDPKGAYVREFVPEIAALPDRFVHKRWAASPVELAAAGIELGKAYPVPVVEHGFARGRALAAYEKMRNKRS